jgi:hypothetical protein
LPYIKTNQPSVYGPLSICSSIDRSISSHIDINLDLNLCLEKWCDMCATESLFLITHPETVCPDTHGHQILSVLLKSENTVYVISLSLVCKVRWNQWSSFLMLLWDLFSHILFYFFMCLQLMGWSKIKNTVPSWA